MVGTTSIIPASSHAPTAPAAASICQTFLLSGTACLLSNSNQRYSPPSPSSLLPLCRHNCLLDYTVTWIRELSRKATQELKRGKDRSPAGPHPKQPMPSGRSIACQCATNTTVTQQGACPWTILAKRKVT